MSRKARQDKSSWLTPSIHVFVGDYGPFKPPRNSAPIERALVLLTSSIANDDDRSHNGNKTCGNVVGSRGVVSGNDTGGGPDCGAGCGSDCPEGNKTADDDDDGIVYRRHKMYDYAARSQELLLDETNHHDPGRFRHVIVVDVADMLPLENGEDENVGNEVCKEGGSETTRRRSKALQDMIRKEAESREPGRGFGKTLLRLFQRLNLRNVALAAEGELCCVLLKLYDALSSQGGGAEELEVGNIWLLHPTLSANFVNNVLVPMGMSSINGHNDGTGRPRARDVSKRNGRKRGGKNNNGHSINENDGTSDKGMQVHVVFRDEAARDRRLGMIRHVFPEGTTSLSPERGGGPSATVGHLSKMFHSDIHHVDDDKEGSTSPSSSTTTTTYDPDMCNGTGKSLFLSTLSVEMNRRSKQYERIVDDITIELARVEEIRPQHGSDDDNNGLELRNVDWTTCERHAGALVLRGNRCVLARSMGGALWTGMRFPSVVPRPDELPMGAALRSVEEFTGAEASEVTASETISPITVYAPNGRMRIVVELYVFYATEPPPDGPLEDQDMEDPDDSPYDWYTYANAVRRLDDERSVAALRSVACVLAEAAVVGILPRKWGGVFGQEMVLRSTTAATTSSSAELTPKMAGLMHHVPVEEGEEWKPSRKGDMLQDVRKANAGILSRLAADNEEGGGERGRSKLRCTILSGFLGSGKTTLLTHILTNYSGLKVAILVNDMGEINIDAAVLSKHSITQREEHLVEMSNGCICCTLREDLLVEVAKIASQGTFDYLIIESTGVSEPMPVAETFTFEDSTGLCLGDIAQIDTLVTVVDGSRFLAELDSIQSLREREWHADPEDRRTISHLLCDQVEFANVITLNKCDLMTVDEKNRVKRLIEHMNPTAVVVESTFGRVPLDTVLGTGLFSMTEARKHDGWLKEARIGEHTPETLEYGISSFTYRARRPFYPHRLNAAVEAMLNKTAPFDESIVLRSKGFVWLANFPALQGDFSLAGNHFSLVPGNPWWAEIDRENWPEGLEAALAPLWVEPHGDRQQEIVIIGKELNREAICSALDECLLGDKDMTMSIEDLNQVCADAGDPFYETWYNAIESTAHETEAGQVMMVIVTIISTDMAVIESNV
eukprot:CAMPEP_0181107682 /NCGR_PEP_ID=MMETSP1071-20121207/17216_1 /TAXON_ID=35127 /ORGANISM="Thalassiosira sp., Strain NH16" /LENGTH=1123 /DNA_ID=CAMNT_0023191213 /DNA_START=147 /DNA_END=3519 /DNA_ORIENTATION=-